MKTEHLVRAFTHSGREYADPDPKLTPEEVKEFYAGIYPELTNAEIEGPEHKGTKAVYEFRKAVGTKGNTSSAMSAGTALIAAERIKQREEKGYDDWHDDEHDDHSLSLAAVCYAAPRPLFVVSTIGGPFSFVDPWPRSWLPRYDDRRFDMVDKPWFPDGFCYPIDAENYTHSDRIRNLVKAGALIAAEIDRLLRIEERREKS